MTMTRVNTILTISGLFLTSILIGIWVSGAVVFTQIYLGLCILGFLGLSIIIGVTDVIRKKRLYIYPGIGFLCLSLAMGTSVVLNTSKDNKQQRAAEQIFLNLGDYKDGKGQYPISLDAINSNGYSTDFTYWTDSTRERFSLSYNFDGWSCKIYDSETMEWVIID